ncbi:MAG: glutamate--tRNA ligase [Planctomycetes bacterium]|nr:glutamate--tRNA ligase [Planctomycetota bacterium]
MVVTRFAPSPTGYLHVGGARTALFNWLWARRAGGTFILRIEDTDQKRNTPTAAQQVMDDLRWLGIEWDEGPEAGGPNGPYLQSQRMDIYDKYIKQLLDEKKAYYCFDTAEELDAFRKEAETQKKSFSYTRPKEFPGESDVEKAKAQGRDVTVRFAVPQDVPLVITDIVRDEITFAASEIGDFIIQKSDGFPTYNFACVVDDYLMKITHIIRGQEHLMNTPGQQALWKALFGDAQLPKYAHMSVTVSDTGGKLSKRERPKALRNAIKTMQDIETVRVGQQLLLPLPDKESKSIQDDIKTGKLAEVGGIAPEELDSFIKGKTTPDMPAIGAMAEYLGVALPEINIVDFFKSGYLPETMVNFLALLGWNPGDNREIMPIGELIESFDLSRLSKSNSLFDRKKLLSFNMEHMKMTPPEKVLEHFRAYLKVVNSPVNSAEDELLSTIIKLCEGTRTLVDIERKSRFLFLDNNEIQYDEKAVKKILLKGDGLAVLAIVRKKLAAMEQLTEQGIEDMLRSLAEEKQAGLGKVAQPLRVAICGTTVSLPIFESVQMLGKENTLARIDTTLKKFAAEN